MRKITLLAAFFMLFQFAFAGGLLTNYNQSAQYIRMLSRNASLDIDGVFYNPAGLVHLKDGWHLSFNSQTIFQTRDITTTFPLLNNGHYEGETKIPVYPNFYAAYKKNKWAFSLGVGPYAGGGTAEFPNGLPSLEIPLSKVVPGLRQLARFDPAFANANGYDLDMAFDASSTFWGIQLGATYAINDKISVFGGVRLSPSINKYEGAISNLGYILGDQKILASDLLSTPIAQMKGLAQTASTAANNLQPIIDGGGADFTLAQLEGAGFIDATQRIQIEGGLVALGIQSGEIDNMNLETIQLTYSGTADYLSSTAESLSRVSDKKVETKQKGLGIAPVLGFNYSPNSDWNVGVKYEFKTKLELENDTKVDDVGLFPDGAKKNNDIPALLTVGVGYRGLKWMEAQLSYNMYFDKNVDFGNNVRYSSAGQMIKREIDNNYVELGLGLQFNVSEKFAFSVGYLYSDNGVGANYQSDFSFTNASNTAAGGIKWKITDRITFDAGISNTFYKDDTVTFTDPDVGSYKETYGKTTVNLAAGITYSIF